MKHYKITVRGKVQGVFYRASAQEEAEKLGIKGYVKNMPDGSVYIEAEGNEEALEKFVEWCEQGPPNAKPENMDIDEGAVSGFDSFKIAR